MFVLEAHWRVFLPLYGHASSNIAYYVYFYVQK